jgi:predicted transcriptional regulator
LSEKERRELSAGNFEIMKLVWEKGEVTVNQVLDSLNAQRKNKLKRASVQVLMNRLEKYGWLTHRLEGRTFYYKALQDQKRTTHHIIEDIKTRVFGGSTREFVKCLFENKNVSSEEIDRIMNLLAEDEEE